MRLVIFIWAIFSSLNITAGTHQHHDEALLEINHAYIKVTPPGIQNTAAYFTIINHSEEDIQLIEAKSQAASIVEIHEHVMHDGMMKMQKVESLLLPKQSTTEFKPGGYHIMFIDVEKTIKENDVVTLELLFSNGESKTLQVKAKEAKVNQKHHHKHH